MNREAQRRLLEALAELYPASASIRSLADEFPGDTLNRDLFYLKEHELIDATVLEVKTPPFFILGDPRITAAGLDFLEDDGGLTAILNTVTVRLHDETIRDLLVQRVEASDAQPSVKEGLKKAILEAPASALSQVAEHVVRRGIEHLPDAIPQLQKLLGL